MPSKCENCETHFKLSITDQDIGKTESQCPNCHTEIVYHCWNCKHSLSVKELFQCSWCGWYICNTCHECKEKCEGRSRFNYIIGKAALSISGEKFLGFQNERFFTLYQLIGNVGKLIVKRTCPRGNWWTSSQINIPRLYGIIENISKKKDAEQYKKRFNKFVEQVFIQKGFEFNLEDFIEAGREGKEEKDVVEFGICRGLVKINPNFPKDSTKLYVVSNEPVCPYFSEPVITQRSRCPKCKRIIEGNYKECPICPPYSKGAKKGNGITLISLTVKAEDIRTCSCPINEFNEKKVGDKNWSNRESGKSKNLAGF